MARERPRANELCLRPLTCPRLFAGWMTSVPLATPGGNAGKCSGRGLSSVKPTVESRLGSFGNRGNGKSRVELRQGLAAITRYLTAHQLPQARALLRLDGQYGTGAVLADLAGFAFVTRGKEYSVLDHPLVQARLHLPPDQFQQREDKSDGSQSLRLPTSASRTGGRDLPSSGGHPSGFQKEESGWRHARRRRVRALLHQSPA